MTAPDERRTVRFVVGGRVQGVWFRAYTKDQARAIGVAGWVRNRDDGTVECLASGSAEQLARLRAALERGSPASRVERLAEEPAPPCEATTFEIRP